MPIEIPVGAIGIKVGRDILHSPTTIQFIDSAGFPMGNPLRFIGKSNNGTAVIGEILGTPVGRNHIVLHYHDGADFYFIPVNRRPRLS